MIDVFVYGTLAPGGRWWSVVEPFVHVHRPGRVRGRLYDTGRGYPAATFGDEDPEIAGVVLTLRDADAAIAHLDRFEGEEYERVEVRTTDGTAVLAYQWRGERAGLTRIDAGSWPIR